MLSCWMRIAGEYVVWTDRTYHLGLYASLASYLCHNLDGVPTVGSVRRSVGQCCLLSPNNLFEMFPHQSTWCKAEYKL